MFYPKQIRNYLFIAVIILLLIFFNSRGWLEIPKNLTFQISRPFLSAFQKSGDFLSENLSFFFTIGDLNRENRALRNQNLELLKINTMLKETARENDLLRARLGLNQENPPHFILSRVAGFNPETGQYLLIDKGKKDGVEEGLAIVTADNLLVGKVAEVNSSFSKVLLIFDENSAINALSQETRTNGIVKGSHGLTLLMEMIPIDKEVKKDEIVLTSGLNDSLPAGLVLGRVVEIISKENAIFKTATVEPLADFKNLEEVFVVKKN